MISPKNAILQWEHDIFHVQIIWHYAYKGTNDILCKWDRGLALFSDKTLQSYFCLTIFCSFYVIIFISFFQDFLDICFFRILVLHQDFPHMFFICNIFFLVQNFLHICFCFFYVLFLAQNFLHICFCHILFFAQNFSFFFFFFFFWWRIAFVRWLTNEIETGFIASQNNCQKVSPSQTSETPRAGFESLQSLQFCPR